MTLLLSRLPVVGGIAFLLVASHANADLSVRGPTGGLAIPNADVQPSGSLALSLSDFQERDFRQFSYRRNLGVAVGLWPGLEVGGRIVDYQPGADTTFVVGPRDLSGNLKLQFYDRNGLRLAAGVTDLAGGARLFGATYGVGTLAVGPVDVTAGYAVGAVRPDGLKTFDGPFGGLAVRTPLPGLSAFVERDGTDSYVGARYALSIGAGATLSVQAGSRKSTGIGRSFGAVGVTVPLGAGAAAASAPRAPQPDPYASVIADAHLPDRAAATYAALRRAGFNDVRVGRSGGAFVVGFENGRFRQNDVDAVGVALGIAAAFAAPGVDRVVAVSSRAGQPLFRYAADANVWRQFIASGDAKAAHGALTVEPMLLQDLASIVWESRPAGWDSRSYVQFSPEVSYVIATDLGVFDYSAGVSALLSVPLVNGFELTADRVWRVAESPAYKPGAAFGTARLRDGWRALALSRSAWLGPNVLAALSVGRFDYDRDGVQLQSAVRMPNGADVVRLNLQAARPTARSDIPSPQGQIAGDLFYRWAVNPATWLEMGWVANTDRTYGPSAVLSRWFGDVAVRVSLRQAGTRAYAGMELSVPLTPRGGTSVGPVTVTGTPRFERGVRTQVASAGTSNAANFVVPNAARPFRPAFEFEPNLLNSGRSSERYWMTQLPRLRDAYLSLSGAL